MDTRIFLIKACLQLQSYDLKVLKFECNDFKKNGNHCEILLEELVASCCPNRE